MIEFPEFVTMQRMYGARDFEFVSICTDGLKKKEKVLDFLKNKGAATKNYLYSAEDKYQLIESVDKNWSGAIPYTLLIAPGGEIVYTHEGIIDPLEVKKEIIKKIGRFFADDKKIIGKYKMHDNISRRRFTPRISYRIRCICSIKSVWNDPGRANRFPLHTPRRPGVW